MLCKVDFQVTLTKPPKVEGVSFECSLLSMLCSLRMFLVLGPCFWCWATASFCLPVQRTSFGQAKRSCDAGHFVEQLHLQMSRRHGLMGSQNLTDVSSSIQEIYHMGEKKKELESIYNRNSVFLQLMEAFGIFRGFCVLIKSLLPPPATPK